MTVFEYGRNQIVVDCGVMFPESDLYGIDLVLPEFDYIVNNQKTLRGIVLTHGHQDHIGGLAYLLKRLNGSTEGVPIYGSAPDPRHGRPQAGRDARREVRKPAHD